MRRTTFRSPAPADTVFAVDAFEPLLGNDLTVLLDLGGGHVERRGRVVAVDVAEDGRAVLVTIESEDDLPGTRAANVPGG